MNILYCGARPEKSSPLLSIAKFLEGQGCSSLFTPPNDPGTQAWMSLVRKADLLVYIDYMARSDWLIRQFRLATALGRPIVRWWVGSDVLHALENADIATWVRHLDRVIGLNIASAPHLKDELKQVEIESTVIIIPPSDLPGKTDAHWDDNMARSVLIYLPSHKADFYGGTIVDALVSSLKEFTFYLVANDGHHYRDCDNVVPLGWVKDMDTIYSKIGCLLRVTRHDGCPRMVAESLARGKYVVYSWPFEGCILAKTFEEVRLALLDVAGQTSVYHEGPEIVRRVLRIDDFYNRTMDAFNKLLRTRYRRSLQAGIKLLPHVLRLPLSFFHRKR